MTVLFMGAILYFLISWFKLAYIAYAPNIVKYYGKISKLISRIFNKDFNSNKEGTYIILCNIIYFKIRKITKTCLQI